VKGNTHPTELADLKGARLVASVEVEDGKRLAESLVKQLTGGDRIKARRMREDFWEFEATHKLLLAANHKPVVRGADHAIWRRIKVVPFEVTIPEQEKDRKLPEKLRAERSGILAWAVRGCLDWQENGLGEPEEVRAATDTYRAEMDVLTAFMEERCVLHEDAHEGATSLYSAYKEWCESSGESPETQTRFGTRLRERGLRRGKDSMTRRMVWYGIDLFANNGPDDGGGAGPENPPPGGPGPKQSKQSETVETNSPREAKKMPGEQNNCFASPQTVSQHAVEDLSEADHMPPEVAAYLADPPRDLLRQAEKCAAEGGTVSRLFKTLVSSVAYGVYGTAAGRCDEVRPAVEFWLSELLGRSHRAGG
ncbi:MAG: phage/plasmid primase, P4 family, partial [Actinomycetota bacterium]|nr:phage/plasmid primase, P4 family [Actinomycetota bacterium]